MIYGFIGTGTISAAMIEGMMASSLEVTKVLVSPRNTEVAKELAARFSKVEIASDNQEVADAAQVVVLAVRPQVAHEVLSNLRISPGRTIISVIAATKHKRLADLTGYPEQEIIRAIPLPFVAYGDGVTAIFPPSEKASSLFTAIGEAVACESKDEFDLLAVASATMGSYYGIMEEVEGWLVAKGMTEEKARSYLTPLYSSLAHVAERSRDRTYAELRDQFSTKGGLNEQVFRDFLDKGGSDALLSALDKVLVRAKG